MKPALDVAKADASIRFDILGKLAEGGMAEILLARVSGIQDFSKFVVLKRILPGRADNPDFVEMFLDEARLAAQLHHQNVVQVYAIGAEEGSYFFSMEYLHGVDGRELLRTLSRTRGTLPVEHALYIASQAAAGLHYAHDAQDPDGRPLGLVHRDVSLSNIFLTYHGAVKVVDFGIAWAEKHHARSQTGGLKGKVLYMSPEQACEEKVDRRSDVYSLGAVLYELVVGARAFRARGSLKEVLDRIVGGEFARPRQVSPSVPEKLEEIICTAMSRDPRHRFATCEELQDALEQFAIAQGLPLSARGLKDFLERSVGYRPEPWLTLGLDPTEQIRIRAPAPVCETVTAASVSRFGLSALHIPTKATVDIEAGPVAAGSGAPPASQVDPGATAMRDSTNVAATAVIAPHAIRKVASLGASARRRRAMWAGILLTCIGGLAAAAAVMLRQGPADEVATTPAAQTPPSAAEAQPPQVAGDSVTESAGDEQAAVVTIDEPPADDADSPAGDASEIAEEGGAAEADSPSISDKKVSATKKKRPRRGRRGKTATRDRDVRTQDSTSNDAKPGWTRDSLYLPSDSR